MSKIQLQDFVRYGKMFELYGSLLSSDRQKIMTSYLVFNMTLTEIAEELGISRQAVLDAVTKSCKKFDDLESSLALLEKRESLTLALQEIKENAKSKNFADIEEKVENILRKL